MGLDGPDDQLYGARRRLASGGLRACRRSAGPCALDERLDAFHDRADRLEIGGFLVRVIGDLDTEGVLDIEDDHGKVERLDLEISQRGRQIDVVAWLLHVLLEDVDDLRRHFVHFALPPCFCRLIRVCPSWALSSPGRSGEQAQASHNRKWSRCPPEPITGQAGWEAECCPATVTYLGSS